MKPTYPKLVCEYCGKKNQLNFEPKNNKEFSKLMGIICGYCGWLAYWQNYYTAQFLMKIIINPYKKEYLKEFYSPKVLRSKGHKTPKSKSI